MVFVNRVNTVIKFKKQIKVLIFSG